MSQRVSPRSHVTKSGMYSKRAVTQEKSNNRPAERGVSERIFVVVCQVSAKEGETEEAQSAKLSHASV